MKGLNPIKSWEKAMNNNQIIFYATPQGNIKVEVVFEGETFWLTQKAMANLFGVEIPAISKHLANIYETSELQKERTISILETVQQEGKRNVKRKVEFYRLEAILAVGYRVNSLEATQLEFGQNLHPHVRQTNPQSLILPK